MRTGWMALGAFAAFLLLGGASGQGSQSGEGGAQLAPPVFHHVHQNSTDPAAAIAGMQAIYPNLTKTTVGGFDAVQNGGTFREIAEAAERETADRLIAAYLADRVGAEFSARISGVTRSALFVRLHDTGADGIVPAAALGKDYYRHSESAHALVGDRTGEAFRLGDVVRVRLVEAIPTAGALRFEMLSEGKQLEGHTGQGRRQRAHIRRRKRY